MKNTAKVTGRLTNVYTLPENPSICEAILDCSRKSGTIDHVPIRFFNVFERLEKFEKHIGGFAAVVGEIRTYNNFDTKTSTRHKSTFLWVDGFFFDNAPTVEEINTVELEGTIVTKGELRETPLGRYICDIILAVPANNRKCSYINVIVWNKTALFMDEYGKIGDEISITGRFQSREYSKDGDVHIAYEVSSSYVSIKENGQQ